MISFVNNESIDKSILEQMLNNKSFLKESIDFVQKLFADEMNTVLFASKQALEGNNHLTELENLYTFNMRVIKEYESIKKYAIDILSVNKDEKIDGELSKQLDLINHVIKKFECIEYNPIIEERNDIIRNGMDTIKRVLNTAIGIEDNYQYVACDSYEKLLHEVIRSYQLVFLNNITGANQVFVKTIKTMNTIEYRATLTHNMESIVKRRRELEVINRIDIDELCANATEIDKSAFEEFYYKCELLYKEIVKKEQNIFKFLNTNDFATVRDENFYEKMFQIKMFSENIEVNKLLKRIFDEFQLNKYKIVFGLYQKISDELNNAMKFSMKEIFNDSDTFKILSCDIVKEFKGLNQYFDTINCDDLKEEQIRKIVHGIKETISIKCQTLRDYNEEYNMTKKEDIVSYEKRLMDYIEEIEENLETYLDESMKKSNASFAKAEDQYNRIFNNIKEINKKYDLKYLKSYLLSEIRTFEDIIKYSVEKLLNSNENLAVKIGKKIIKSSQNIDKSLKLAGFVIINPVKEEMFDGNVHEIINAKKIDGYDKGVIYEVHAKGYQFNDYVIQRANVSVAK